MSRASADLRLAFIAFQRRWTGAAHSLLGLVDGLPVHGIVPHVVLQTGSPVASAVLGRGVPLALVPMRRWMEPPTTGLRPAQALGRLALNLASLPGLLRQLRAWQVDLIVTNGAIQPLGAFAAAILNRPHVWIVREFGLLDYDSPPDFGRPVFEYWLRRASRVIAVSEAVRRVVLGNLPPGRVDVIHNGVAFEAEFDALRSRARDQRREDGSFTFLLIGRIRTKKGQESAIRAFSQVAGRFPGARLEIVGSGEAPDIQRCRALVNDLGLAGRVELHDHVADPWPYFLRADAVLMCSAWEAMGRVTAEAMAACRPVIGHDRGGTSELIRHEQTGLLYTGGDEALADCMRRFLEAPAWARQLGEQAWQDARERFTIELYASRVAAILRAATAEPSAEPNGRIADNR